MTTALVLAVLATVCAVASWRLTRARWTWRAPRSAIFLWQSLGVTWGLASTGALLSYALAPRGVVPGLATLGDGSRLRIDQAIALAAGLTLFGVLVAVLVAACAQTLIARHRHRVLLRLIARDEPGVPGVRVVDHPGAAAYCVPGLKSQVVISAGTLRLLSADELRAVLAHEAAHARERHDLVLLPFAALRRAVPVAGIAHDAVALLIEMAADDRARRYCSAKRLATALLRFGSAGSMPAPSGAMGAYSDNVMARVDRLMRPASLPRHARVSIVTGAALLAMSAPLLWVI